MSLVSYGSSTENLRLPKKSYARIPDILPLPSLIEVQLKSFRWFMEEGLREVLDEISPIEDFTGRRMALYFGDYEFGKPQYTEWEARERDVTYAAPLRVEVTLVVRGEDGTKVERKQKVFMGDFPLMTSTGTFIINGAERVVVSQLIRSPGVYLSLEPDPISGRRLCFGKVVPNRGAWLEFESSPRTGISARIDRKKKLPVTTFLRAVGFGSDEELFELFEGVDTNPEFSWLRATLARDPVKNALTRDRSGEGQKAALEDFHRRMRPGDPPNEYAARQMLDALYFNPRRYDLGRVGRYKLNRRLEISVDPGRKALTAEDLVEMVRRIILLNNYDLGPQYCPRCHLAYYARVNPPATPGRCDRCGGLLSEERPDDVDHLGNRRVRTVGELIQNQFRVGLLRMERVVRERMTITPPEEATPSALVNIRPVTAAIKEFFGSSQLSQFMDQTNPLAELTHKRRLSALGPGGLSRERAGFEVRDVHHSHYGRICPVETPEGPNIGLITSMATYARVNEYGFLETPYRRVKHEVPNRVEELVGRILREPIYDENGQELAPAGTEVDRELAERISRLPIERVRVRPFVSDEVEYLTADQEERYYIAQANVALDERGHFLESRIEVRHGPTLSRQPPERIDYVDVSPKQIVSVSASLIPFLEHDDANRALMGSNMQRQAVPLVRPQAPIIATGMEGPAARDSGQVITADTDGTVVSVTGHMIKVVDDEGREHIYALNKFYRSNQATCINQRPIVAKGERVRKGQVLADSSSTDQGELALGQNVLVAFMSWEGGNFEDAIIISERLVRDDVYTSVHIEEHEVEARDTKLGPEEITRDIPNVGEESLRDLDESGIIRIGAEVQPGDILVGKVTPKGETELTPEEKLLRAIFGEKARDVKDTSLRVPHGEYGKVIDVKVFSREQHDELPAGVNKLVRVSIAQRRKIAEGDKMAGRHGNKGVVAIILPEEDMPFLEDGTPVDIILNPIGVPSRMNLGQVLETHLGWAARALGFRAITPVFDGASEAEIEDALARTWFMARALGRTVPVLDARSLEEIEGYKARAKAWLNGLGYDGERLFDDRVVGEARRVCLELWLNERLAELGRDPIEPGQTYEALLEKAERISRETGKPIPIHGKQILRDGRTGEPFDQPVTVGYIYMMKLVHLVEDKIHARSTGPYSLITQQPLGGKAQFGGQRFGEMEVWALEAYGAAYTLQEMLTVKSDDVVGRVKTYEAIVKGEDIAHPHVPESFKVLVKELQSLALSVEVLNEEEQPVAITEFGAPEVDEERILRELGINISGIETSDLMEG